MLAEVGQRPVADADAARGELNDAVATALQTERSSRSFLDLVFQAYTVDLALTEMLQTSGDVVGDGASRSVRWLGGLPDSVEGVDTRTTAEAIRSIRALDPAAFEYLAHDVFGPLLEADLSAVSPRPAEFKAVIGAALGGSEGSPVAAQDLGNDLSPDMMLALSRGGLCVDIALIDDVMEVVRNLPLVYLVAAARYSQRCGGDGRFDLDSASVAGLSLIDDGAVDCADDGAVSGRVRSLASEALSESPLEWMSPVEQVRFGRPPSLERIYEHVVVARLAEGSCEGYWWA